MSSASVAGPIAWSPRSCLLSASARPMRISARVPRSDAVSTSELYASTAVAHSPDARARSADNRSQIPAESARNRLAGSPNRCEMKLSAAIEGFAWPFSSALMYALV
jgi:hypothetical protein